MASTEPLAISVADAALRLGVSYSTVRAMIADGRLPVLRLVGRKGTRGRVLVRVADLNALLDKAAATLHEAAPQFPLADLRKIVEGDMK